MKTTIKKVLLVLAIASTSLTSANNGINQENVDPQALAMEIKALLKNPKFKITDDISTEVTFVFNEDDEIVVLNVDTDNKELENFIKNRLNYKQLLLKEIKNNGTYKVPVRFTTK